MSEEKLYPEDWISEFSVEPLDIGHSVLPGTQELTPATFSPVQRHGRHSSFGVFDQLPVELLHLVCNALDLQSLSRLSCTSLRGKEVVESLLTYRELMRAVPHTLATLGRTGLSGAHTIDTLYKTLQSVWCVWCKGFFGGFIFLPTYERCCYDCVFNCPSLRVVPLDEAKQVFGLDHEMDGLPLLHSLPYVSSRDGKFVPRRWLVSVRMAKQRALAVHGPMANFAYPKKDQASYKVWCRWKGVYEASLDPENHDPFMWPQSSWGENALAADPACVRFPTLLADGTLEPGHWCAGCIYSEVADIAKKVEREGSVLLFARLARNIPPSFMEMWTGRDEEDMLEHITVCPGVMGLFAAWRKEREQESERMEQRSTTGSS